MCSKTWAGYESAGELVNEGVAESQLQVLILQVWGGAGEFHFNKFPGDAEADDLGILRATRLECSVGEIRELEAKKQMVFFCNCTIYTIFIELMFQGIFFWFCFLLKLASFPVFLSGESHGQRSLAGYSP